MRGASRGGGRVGTETGELTAIAQQLGSRYLVGELIGRGAMGQVFAGTARDDGSPVAIKVLRPELVSDPQAVARFMQERQILTSISSPATVRIIDLVAEGDTLAIVMELVSGHDLRRYLRAKGTLPPAEAAGLAVQLLTGLAAVHAAGVVHRDIKPENLLLDGEPDGGDAASVTLKVTDFGVARLSYGASLTKLSSLIGTPEYMAPELAEGDHAGPAADLYSAGVVLYEMLSGRTPFAGGPPMAVLRRHADMAPPPVPGLPPALGAELKRLLAKDPGDRPASAAEAAAALAALASELAPMAALPPMAEPDHYQRVTANMAADSAAASAATATDIPLAGTAGATVIRPREHAAALAPAAADGAATPPGAAGLAAGPARAGAGRPLLAGAAAVVIAVTAVTVTLALRPHHPTPRQPAAAGGGTGTAQAAAAATASPLTSASTPPSAAASARPPSLAPSGRTSSAAAAGAPVVVITEPAAGPSTTAAAGPSTTAAAPSSPAQPAQPAPVHSTAAPAAASYASVPLATGSSTVTARAYFGQLSSVMGALTGQVTFGSLTSAGADPGGCAETVVFSGVPGSTGVVYAGGLGSGWRGAEAAPSSSPDGGNSHQQIVAPPLSLASGSSYAAYAQLVAGTLKLTSGSFSLSLSGTAGSVQTWLVAGARVSCDG